MPDLGKKFECYNCGTKFYNLGRPEAICPKCGVNQKNAKSEDAPVVDKAIRDLDIPRDATIVAVVLAIPFGMLAAVRQDGWLDYVPARARAG